MAKAYFNTPVYSPLTVDSYYDYNLDTIITKDFGGPYTYTITSGPEGAFMNDSVTLRVNNDVESTIDILVQTDCKEGPCYEITASTDILADGTVNFFTKRINFFGQSNFFTKFDNTQTNWPTIVANYNQQPKNEK